MLAKIRQRGLARAEGRMESERRAKVLNDIDAAKARIRLEQNANNWKGSEKIESDRHTSRYAAPVGECDGPEQTKETILLDYSGRLYSRTGGKVKRVVLENATTLRLERILEVLGSSYTAPDSKQ